MRYRLVIFDWDGTLMDSEARIVACMQAAARDIEWPALSHEAVRDIIGLGLPEAIARLCPGIDSRRAELMRQHYANHFVTAEEALPSMPFFAGVESGIARLRQNPSQLLAVATGKSRRGLDRIFNKTACGPWFHASRTADMTLSKPDPLMLVELISELDVAADEALMVGDSEYDMGMAVALGMDCAAVTYGVHSRKRLEAFKPVMVADHFTELVDWLVADKRVIGPMESELIEGSGKHE
ncbi:HAD family hydrolase [Phytohalomonas tamaricis]|uniref:HAD family hydrolase n=1 Tax=Phytohalomonas tamaricis TaxID=2081032 RepID=UPI000D0B727D|nr:HAD hydrolase-like protein [Phytohalomonas tamaricis]